MLDEMVNYWLVYYSDGNVEWLHIWNDVRWNDWLLDGLLYN
jgi:hypothetical protein